VRLLPRLLERHAASNEVPAFEAAPAA
jgi:hypothetical protein